MERYILAHDIGTSSDKAVLVTFDGKAAATCTAPYPTYYPNPGWVEQDPEDYWKAVCETSKNILEKTGVDPSAVKAVVFSTQAQGVIPVDVAGNALYSTKCVLVSDEGLSVPSTWLPSRSITTRSAGVSSSYSTPEGLITI